MDPRHAAQVRSLFEALSGPLQLYARTWVDADLARDLTQEAFVRLMASHPPADPTPWLFRVVRNLAISKVRAAGRRQRLAARGPTISTEFVHDPASPLAASEAQAALARLDPEHREMLVLHLYAGLSFQAAAAIAGTNPTNAFRTYRAALTQLRLALEAACPTSKKK